MERELYCSRHTISDVLDKAKKAGISWPLGDDVTNEMIQELLFPGKYALACPYTLPDFAEIHRELAKNGVTLTLLWEEYCVKVRLRAEFRICTRSTARSTAVGPRYESDHAHHAQARRRRSGGLGGRSSLHH